MGLPPFAQAVAMHGPAVLRVCRALLGPNDAEDACADTFLAALQAYDRLTDGSNVRRLAGHHCPQQGHRPPPRRVPSTGSDRAMADRVATEAAESMELDGRLWEEVRAIPPKQRAAVAYHHLADLPYAEVAVLLGTSATAARRSAADGIATLRSTNRLEDQR